HCAAVGQTCQPWQMWVLPRGKVHVVSFLVLLVKCDACSAVCSEVFFPDKGSRGQAQAVAKILTQLAVVKWRLNCFPLRLRAGANQGFSVICQNSEGHAGRREEAGTANIRGQRDVSLIRIPLVFGPMSPVQARPPVSRVPAGCKQ